MLRDVFYYGKKPNVHPREKFAKDLVDARNQSTTDHFWIINEFCDYRNFDWDFDFEFLPDEDVWAEEHNNVWPSQHQKDSGTWLCPKNHSDLIVYRADVDVVKRKKDIVENWVFLDKIDKTKFDFSWHPDPTDPPYIYKWGCKFYPVELKACLEYHVSGATEVKYLNQTVDLEPDWDNLVEFQQIDKNRFDLTWRPNPLEPPYIYVWGNKYDPAEVKPTLEYHVPGATEKKYMGILDLEPEWDRWTEHITVDKTKFDFRWRPDPNLHEPPYIYVWGNKYDPAEVKPTLEYHVPGATEYKYMGIVDLEPEWDRWVENIKIDKTKFDFSWRPDPNLHEPPYIYVWGNKHIPGEIKSTLEYHVPSATEKKYMAELVPILPELDKWKITQPVTNDFDFTWHPNPTSPPYIYVWGNNWVPGELKPTIEYYCEGATEKKYMGNVDVVPEYSRWNIVQEIDKTKFDLTWRPDPREPAYIYVWGNKHIPGEIKSTLEYHCEGATEKKYMGDAPVLPENKKWNIVQEIDTTQFDLTWRPDPREPAYIYVWGNQYVPAEILPTIEYHCDGATEKKYMGNITVVPEYERWKEIQKVVNFDFSWRPDPREPAYIYVWGNKWIPGELQPTLEYHVPGATERKYMGDVEVAPNNNWKIYQKIDSDKFDLTWRPDPREPAYIYVWGNKWVPGEIKPTIEYVCEGATEKKYMGDASVLTEVEKWKIHIPVDDKVFDMSWRPDPREPAYIYVWGNKFVPAELRPTIEYYSEGATERKYMGEVVVLPQWENYKIHALISDFDFSWLPDPREPAYIYVWGNKHVPGELQATLEYVVPGATERKYMGNVNVLSEIDRWVEHQLVDKTKFDMTWRPDPREPAYIYVWGNKWINGELKPTISYHCPEAVEYKYMGNAEVLPELDRWKEIQPIDKTKFDLTWRPDPREPAYVYVWGNKHIRGELKSTIEYHVPGAIERKYIQMPVDVLPETERWSVIQEVEDFDFTWRPDPREPAYIYVWGNKHILGEIKSTVEYHCPGATERKYIGNASVKPNYNNWKILIPVDKTSFDFTWRPDPREPAYIYVWGNQYNKAEIEPTIEYYCEGATERKYVNDTIVKTLPMKENWKVLIPIDDFDFSWRPDPHSPPYIYVFGNQWHDAMTEPTIEYHVTGATDRKYITEITAKVTSTQEYWKTLLPVDRFDYSWRPNPHSQPYIYVFGNQWHNSVKEPTVEFHTPGATEKKYIDDVKAIVKSTSTEKHWKNLIPVETFDYSWRPDPDDPPYIYVFGNKWNDAATEPTIEYHCEGATDRKYLTTPVAVPHAQLQFWSINNNDDLETFDFTWRPNPHSPPQIYQWADNGPRYTVPGASEVVYMSHTQESKRKIINRYVITTSLEDLIRQHSDEVFWALNPDLNYDKFDFNWKPNENNFKHINVFGNEYSKNTQTYFVNGPMYMLGHREYNYVEDQVLSVNTNLSMFYIDRSNNLSDVRFQKLKDRFPKLQKTRYLKSWVDTINRCVSKSETKLFWVLSSEIDYTDFEFDFYPSPWQEKMVHVFGTQWSHWGHTYLINKETFPEDTKYVKIVEHLSVLNFVKTKKAKATDCLYDVYMIDHGNTDIQSVDINFIKIKFEDSYLQTFNNLLKLLPTKQDHYIWIISSICDYTNFDFSYVCDPYTKEQLHVFPSNNQKFGDTFFINVNRLRDLISNLTKLEDYERINFNAHQRVTRLPAPRAIINRDTYVDISIDEYAFPYVEVVTSDNSTINADTKLPMSIWAVEHRNIIVNSTGATNIVLPQDYRKYVENEMYDYPYIKKVDNLIKSNPIDIVFLSNGEKCADENYEHLLSTVAGRKNRVVRVDGVNGRVEAYHAAARASNTPWLFTVFAKLKVNKNFDWDWQPDRLQIPKHYIFHALNPINKLVYGHQAMIAYNKNLTLGNMGYGLDFTMDNPNEVVEILSGTAMFNTDEYSTWRTAFREAIKLHSDASEVSKERLSKWLTVAEGDYAEYSIKGASDAIEYYESVNGDYSKLKLSYEWEWLNQYFTNKYKL